MVHIITIGSLYKETLFLDKAKLKSLFGKIKTVRRTETIMSSLFDEPENVIC